MKKIYDVFPFFNELNLLKVRLETLWDEVDYFVICEADRTFSGNPKSLIFKSNQEDFSKYSSKIIHLTCLEDLPGLTPFEREWFQRDYFKASLDNLLSKSDYILYSDVDEIPRPSAIRDGAAALENSKGFVHFAQDLFYYFFNLMEVSGTLISSTGEYPGIKKRHRKWLGTVMLRWEDAGAYRLSHLRSPDHKAHGIRISDAGWHFSFIGGEANLDPVARASLKIEGYAHQEFNNEKIKRNLLRRISKGRDIFGRRSAKFKSLKGFAHLPRYVQEHLDDYEALFTK